MDLRLLNRAMRAEAKGLGLCDKWYGEWSEDSSVDELLNKYMKGIDFCIRNDYPSNSTMLEYAGREKLHEHGIFIDEEITESSRGMIVINGHCTGRVNYDGFNVGDVYVLGKSEVTINVSDFAKVFVEVWGDARVTVINKGENRCFVYRHGGEVHTKGDVVIRDKTMEQNAEKTIG